MAVDSKQGTPTTNGTNGATANGQRTKGGRKRSSSLMASASSLPTVEHSLEEFIAKANQTLVDVSTWGNASEQAREEDEKLRAADAQRMKAAESQLREGEAREHSLRRQLDGLQGKLAEAEARAAVAASAGASGPGGNAAHDQTLHQLRAQIAQAEAQRKAFDDEKQALARALAEARQDAVAARTSATAMSLDSGNDGEAAERVRIAEAKATKAIAAARAAQAGLTVSSADIAAIESGLVVTNMEQPKGFPWVAILLAFVGGCAIMFAVWKLVLTKDTKAGPAAAAQPAVTQPAADVTPAPTPTAPAKPVVTPIEEPTTQPAATTDDKAAATTDKAAAPVDTAATDKAAPPVDTSAADKAAAAEAARSEKAEAAATAKAEKAAAAKEAADKAAAAKAEKAAAAKAAKANKPAAKPSSKPAAKPAAGGIADPFAETPAKKPAKATKPAKPAGGIVDPF